MILETLTLFDSIFREIARSTTIDSAIDFDDTSEFKLLVPQACNQEFFGAGEVSWDRGTLINVSCTTFKRKDPEGNTMLLFLQDTLKTAF